MRKVQATGDLQHLLELYYEHWLHGGAEVEMEASTLERKLVSLDGSSEEPQPPSGSGGQRQRVRARVEGVNEYGYLLARILPAAAAAADSTACDEGQVPAGAANTLVALEPDLHSLDLLENLVCLKNK